MLRIRRIYFFWIAYCSLSMLVLGITTLARVLIEQLLGAPSSGVLWLLQGREHFREQTALGIALAAIGLPVWLLHWRKAQAWLSGEEGDDERASSLRRLYVYAVLLTTALTGYVAGRDLLAHFIGLLLRVTEPSERVANLARPLPYLLVAMAFWAYHHRIAREDRAAVGEMGASATLRRWYVYGMAVVAVLPLMFNLTELGRQAWFAIFDRPLLGMVGSAASANTVAQCSGTVLAALAVWLLHRAYSEAALSSRLWHGESESHSVLRKVYLYAVVTLTVTWALANAGQVLRYLLLQMLGEPIQAPGGEPVVLALGEPVVSILIFGMFWGYFWRAVRKEAGAEQEIVRQADIRRLYYYLVSAVSVTLIATSAAGILRLLTDALLQVTPLQTGGLRQEIATYLSMLLIGAPVWLFHWGTVQRLVAADARSDSKAETRATARRVYLYVVALASVLVLLVSSAWLVYDLVVTMLGQPLDRKVQVELAHLVANSSVAAVLLWYHWWLVLRADHAAIREARAGRSAMAVIDGLDSTAAAELERFVREKLQRARLKLIWDEGRAGAVGETT